MKGKNIMKEKKPANTIFYENYKEMIYSSTPEQCKEIMTAFCQYAFDDIEPEVSGQINLLWGIIKGNIDKDRKQYIERCEQNRENARKRYNKDRCIETFDINGEILTIEYTKETKDCIPNGPDELMAYCNGDVEKAKKAIEAGNKAKWVETWEFFCDTAV